MLVDLTFTREGQQISEQAIFDAIEIIAGSGNFTCRNVGYFNLETSLRVRSARPEFITEFTDYWNRQWENRDAIFTESLDEYKKPAAWQHLVYRAQEATGLSTF